jgi:endonuclease/exonuclease/phosphatase family metal-dependent hydrolase
MIAEPSRRKTNRAKNTDLCRPPMPFCTGGQMSFTRLIVLALLAITLSRLVARSSLSPDFNVPVTATFSSDGQVRGNIRIATWNIDRGYRLSNVMTALQRVAPDICLLQEVDLHDRRTGNRDVGREIAISLGRNYAFGIEFQELSQSVSGRPAFHGQATLSRFPIIASRVLRFKRQSGFWNPKAAVPNVPFFQRRIGGRIALVTELSISGKLLVVYNAHLESRSGGLIQDAQMREILDDLKRYPAGTPAIIGGDLNSKYHPGRVLKGLERENFRSVLGERLQRTHVIIGVLDWIFVRGPFTIESGSVLRGTHGSDHDLVQAVLVPTGRFAEDARTAR